MLPFFDGARGQVSRIFFAAREAGYARPGRTKRCPTGPVVGVKRPRTRRAEKINPIKPRWITDEVSDIAQRWSRARSFNGESPNGT